MHIARPLYRILHPFAPIIPISIMSGSLYPAADSGSSAYSTSRVYSDYPSTRNFPPAQFSDSALSTSLGVITFLTDCGLGEFESTPKTLYRLRQEIVNLLLHCLYADKELYTDYIQAFLKRTHLLVGKLIVPALRSCLAHICTPTCSSVIREAYALVLLVYLFANPLKLSKILTDNYSLPSPHGINVTSLETNLLLETARDVQKALFKCSQNLKEPTQLGEGSAKDLHSEVEEEHRQSSLDLSLDLVSRLIITVITNSVPTSVFFLYYKDLLASGNFTLLDFEYFEEFLTHFAAVNDLAIKASRPILFEHQKSLIKDHFLSMIESYASYPVVWCTSEQALNYLQVFIDIYNEVYGSEVSVEKSQGDDDSEEYTVIKNREYFQPLDRGHYKKYLEEAQAVPVPDFVNFFKDEELSETVSESYPEESSPIPGHSVGFTSPFRSFEEKDIRQMRFGVTASTVDSVPASQLHLHISHLNDAVAEEVRGRRSEFEEKHVENRVFFEPKVEVKCFKCKYIPWHKHKIS